MKHSHESVLVEMDRLNLQIKDEQNKKLTLQQDLKIAASKNALVIEVSIWNFKDERVTVFTF